MPHWHHTSIALIVFILVDATAVELADEEMVVGVVVVVDEVMVEGAVMVVAVVVTPSWVQSTGDQ